MNGYELSASIVESILNLLGRLAWPSAVCVIVGLLAKDIGALMRRIKSGTYRDLTVDFDNEASDLAQESRVSTEPEQSTSRSSGTVRSDTTAPGLTLVETADLLAQTSPTSAILFIWADVEDEIRSAARRHQYKEHPTATVTLAKLVTHKLVHVRVLTVAERLRLLRNKAAHKDFSGDEPSKEAVHNYALAARFVVDSLKRVRAGHARPQDTSD